MIACFADLESSSSFNQNHEWTPRHVQQQFALIYWILSERSVSISNQRLPAGHLGGARAMLLRFKG